MKETLVYDVNGNGAISSAKMSVRKLKARLHQELKIKYSDMRVTRIS